MEWSAIWNFVALSLGFGLGLVEKKVSRSLGRGGGYVLVILH